MWTRFKDLWWIKKGKWSTGSLGNGTRAFTVVSHLLPNASGGQVGPGSSSTLKAGLYTRLIIENSLKFAIYLNEEDRNTVYILIILINSFFNFCLCCFLSLSGSMPTDYELYYGFTRFAIELNELCPELKDVLPRTDARFRPDQRYNIGTTTASMSPPPYTKQCNWFPTNKIAASLILLVLLRFAWRMQTEWLFKFCTMHVVSTTIWYTVCVYWKVIFGSHRHLEEGNLEMASSEKQRIEDLQRTRRKWREESDIKQEPRFFKYAPRRNMYTQSVYPLCKAICTHSSVYKCQS